jgi:hypothetical protein
MLAMGRIHGGESAAIMADCVDISATIKHVKFQQCSREANKVAHDRSDVLAPASICSRFLNFILNTLSKC